MGLRLLTREEAVPASPPVEAPAERADAAPGSQIPLYVLWAATAVFVGLFSILVLYKHAHLGTRAFDLGIFDQGLWLLSEGETPFVTIRGLHLFGDHTSFILYLLVPLYWIWADVTVLLILTVLAMAAGGPLVYAAARAEGLGRGTAAALGMAFLLAPAVQWQVWDVFHPETLAIPILLSAYLLALRRRPAWALLALAVALLAKEDAALIVITLAIYLGYRSQSRLLGWGGAALGVAHFLLSFFVFLPHWSPTGELIYSGRYAEYGSGFTDMAWGIATSPLQVAGEFLTADALLYQAGLLLPLVMALAAPRVLLLGAPTLLANILSAHIYQVRLQYHYTAYLIVVMAIAAVVGTKRLIANPPRAWIAPRAIIGLVLVAGVIGSLGGPWGIWHRNPWAGNANDSELVTAGLEVVPPEASVAADSRIVVHLAHRKTVYMFPNPMIARDWSASGADKPPRHDFDWLVVRADLEGMDHRFMAAYADATVSGLFELVYSNAEVAVWRRAVPLPDGCEAPEKCRPPLNLSGSEHNGAHHIAPRLAAS